MRREREFNLDSTIIYLTLRKTDRLLREKGYQLVELEEGDGFLRSRLVYAPVNSSAVTSLNENIFITRRGKKEVSFEVRDKSRYKSLISFLKRNK